MSSWRCHFYINRIYNNGVLYLEHFIKEYNDNYIIAINWYYFGDSELDKIFDLKVIKLEKLMNLMSNNATLIIDIYEDK